MGRLGMVGAVVVFMVAGAPVASGAAAQTDGSSIYVVRHAETTADRGTPGDPELSDAGLVRAGTLAEILSPNVVTSVHATDFRRTRGTADVIAERSGREVEIYNPSDQAGMAALVARLRTEPGHHVVVGHSNTVPGMVSAIGGDPGWPLGEAEYDRLYVIEVGADGNVTSTLRRYGARSEGPPSRDVPDAAVPDPNRMVEGSSTLVMSLRGDSVGTAIYETQRTDDGWRFTETTVLGSLQVDVVSQAHVARDFASVRFTSLGSMFGNEVDIDVAFERDRAQGTSVFPREGGSSPIDLDVRLPEGTLERTSVFFVAAALPFTQDGYFGLQWFDTYTGDVQRISAVVAGRESVQVPAGTFDAWRIELRGGTPSQVLWVSVQAPHRIVRMEVVGQPWTYELVAAGAR